jgi:hypothetical protein
MATRWLLSALFFGVLGAGAAEGEVARHCRAVALPSRPTLPADTLPFAALAADHVKTLAAGTTAVDQKLLQAPFEQGGRFNESEGGAVAAVVTKQHRPAKLLLTVRDKVLTIRELTTFGTDGGIAVRRTGLTLAEGQRIDLDRGSVVTGAADTDLRWSGKSGRLTLSPANGARLAVLVPRIAIPVIAHFMTRRDDGVDTRTLLPIEDLQSQFAPEGGINRIWDRAGLLFVVSRVEACTYSVRDFLPERREPEPDGVPAPGGDCRSLFRRINSVHNSPIAAAGRSPDSTPAYGVDLYLWMAVGWVESDRLFGFGAQHRADGPNHGPGAVWMSAGRCQAEGPDCAPRIAHELGHFLGLCHVCLTDAVTPASERGSCGFCTNVPACAAGQRNLLMRDDAAGDRLTPGEVGQARQKALEHRWRHVSQ